MTTTTTTTTTSRPRHSVPLHRCRFPTWSPSSITSLTITPTSFDTSLLNFGGQSGTRGLLGVGRGNGDVDLMLWGGEQGWVAWRTLPSSFPPTPTTSTRKPLPLLSHLLFTHQTTLSPSDVALYEDDLGGARREMRRLKKEGVRLFGVGGRGSELVEWCWGGPGMGGKGREIGRIKSTLPPLPPIFSLASTSTASHLAIGLEDGTIRLVNILDDEFELIGKVEVGGGLGRVRITSLIWGECDPVQAVQGGDKEDVSMSDDESPTPLPLSYSTPSTSLLIAGTSSSSILILRTSSSPLSLRPSHRLTLDKLPNEQTVVWSLRLLNKEEFVSGDSMGNVMFWDAKMGTKKEGWRGHKSDVLDLCVGSDGTTLFSTGVDQKTVEYRQVTISSKSSSGPTSRWVQSSGRRLHSHDVRSLVISPPFSPSLSPSEDLVPILTSGGLDFSLITISVSSPERGLRNPIIGDKGWSTEFESGLHRRAGYVRQRESVFKTTIGTERLLVGRKERGVEVWKLEPVSSGGGMGGGGAKGWREKSSWTIPNVGEDLEEEEKDENEKWKMVLQMELKVQTNLIGMNVSDDGKWLVVSDLFETKLFRLSFKNDLVTPHRIKSFSLSLSAILPPNSLGTGTSTQIFTRDSKRLLLTTCFGSNIVVVDLEGGQVGEIRLMGRLKGKKGGREVKGMNGNGAHESGSEREEESEEEREEEGEQVEGGATIVCVGISNDGKWYAMADLERRVAIFDLETLSHYTTLPTPSLVPTSLTFLPTPTSPSPTLILTFSDNSIALFSLPTLQYLSWALPLSSPLSNPLMEIREPIIGLTFEPSLLNNGDNKKVHESRRNGAGANADVGIVWGANWVAKVDFESVKDGESGAKEGKGKKRGRSGEKEKEEKMLDFKVTRRYQPIVHFGFVGAGELCVVERTWFDLAKELPDAWSRNGEYGT